MTTEWRSDWIGESYGMTLHRSGLPIYVFPKKLTTTYAILATKYGATDVEFRRAGEDGWTTVPDGVAHFLEHKLFENEDGSDSMEHFSAYGADSNAYTAENRTAYLFTCTERFEESLEELLTFVTSPYFTERTVKKEQGIIAEEIRMYEDNPWERCFQNLMEGMYHVHPIRRRICGDEQSITEITAELLYRCHSLFYQLSNMALIVCGDVSEEQVLRVADRVLPTTCADQPIERRLPDEPPQVRVSEVSDRMQVAKPIFTVGIKDAGVPDPPEARVARDAAMSLLGEILFSRSGELYSRLFEEGLLTNSYSYGYSISSGVGFHTVSGESDEPQTVAARIRAHLEKTLAEGIDPEAFERCRRVLCADELRSYDSTDEIANDLLACVCDGVDLFAYPEALRRVRREELSALLAELLREDAFCLSAIYPLENDGEVDA